MTQKIKKIITLISPGIIIGFFVGIYASLGPISNHQYIHYKLYKLIALVLQDNLNKWVALTVGLIIALTVICHLLNLLFKLISKKLHVKNEVLSLKHVWLWTTSITLATYLLMLILSNILNWLRSDAQEGLIIVYIITLGYILAKIKQKEFFYLMKNKSSKLVTMLVVILLLFINLYVFIDDKQKQKNKPNIIILLIDALRSDHLGCYGYERNTTPNIDKLAEESFLFKNTIAQSSWTRPSVASILTGQYPVNHGVNGGYGITNKLNESMLTLPEILKENGYNTLAFSVNPNITTKLGFAQAFDKFIYSHRSNYKDNIHTRSNEINKDLVGSINKLKEKSQNFIYVHYMDPHVPYTPGEKHFSKSNKVDYIGDFFRNNAFFSYSDKKRLEILQEMINAYDDEILFNDKMIGNALRALKDNNMYDNSIIIITADHGEEFMEHGSLFHGTNLFDEQIKVPLIIHTPDNIHKKIEEQAGHIDLLPTLLECLQIPIPENLSLDGHNLFGGDKYKYTFSELAIDDKIGSTIRSLEDKLIFFKNKEDAINFQPYYFDLASDPKEQNNLYHESMGKKQSLELEEKLQEYLANKKRLDQPKKPIEYDKETLEELKALGYIQ